MCCSALASDGLLVLHEPLSHDSSHWLATLLTNTYALCTPARVLRALGRRIGVHTPEPYKGNDRPEYTPYERPFASAQELLDMLPASMSMRELRSQMVLSGRDLPRHVRAWEELLACKRNEPRRRCADGARTHAHPAIRMATARRTRRHPNQPGC